MITELKFFQKVRRKHISAEKFMSGVKVIKNIFKEMITNDGTVA